MTRFQHRPLVGHPFYSHVIVDTATGKEVAWSTSLKRAELAVRLCNEEADDERTFFISPERLLAELRAEQLTDEPWSELKRTGTGGWL